MGSVGPHFRCPLCGRIGVGGYSLDWIGYPTCDFCNMKDKGLFDGLKPTELRKLQLLTICAKSSSWLALIMDLPWAEARITRFLAPAADCTGDFDDDAP